MNAIILAFWIVFVDLSAYGLVKPHDEGSLASKDSLNGRAETETEYLVTPVDAQNPDLIQDTEQYLREVTGKSDLYNFTNSENRFHWWIVDLTDRQRNKVQEHRDVEFVGSTGSVEAPEDSSRHDGLGASNSSKRRQLRGWTKEIPPTDTHEKRAPGQNYAYQRNTPEDLLDISRKRVYGTAKDSTTFVYPEEAGKGGYLYQIEHGILPGFEDEFPSHRVGTTLRTPRYRELQRQNAPLPPPSFHSTCTASKAMGTKYGAAKKATIISVTPGDYTLTSLAEAFNVAADDIARKGRKRKSVVVASINTLKTLDELEAEACNHPGINALEDALARLLDMGVPVVVSAGNNARKRIRETMRRKRAPNTNPFRLSVDTLPAALASSHLPIFVIGAADENGMVSGSSQRGSKVTGYARGTDCRCAGESEPVSGTSFATAAWAGTLITFMGRSSGELYETYTRGKRGREFIDEVHEFVTRHAFWVRANGVKMIWNLATEADFPNG